MRASTLLGLGVALMLGVVVVAGIRFSGLLNRSQVAAPKVEPVMVLAARKNLYEGTAATVLDVGVRPASSAEITMMGANPEKFFFPNPEAAHLRILARNVPADQVLRQEDFHPMILPEAVGVRLGPGMRAVDIELPKDRAAGGLLRIGERVDIFLTSKIFPETGTAPARTAIAPIAKDLRIIVKRDALVTLMVPVPEDKPVSFIVEANPYRAALIEYAKSKGNLTLVVSPGRKAVTEPVDDLKLEQELVDSFMQGKASVNETDLERIFRLKPIPPAPPLRVEHLNGTQVTGVSIIDPDAFAKAAPTPIGYRFAIPDDTVVQAAPAKTAGPPTNNISAKSPTAKKKL